MGWDLVKELLEIHSCMSADSST